MGGYHHAQVLIMSMFVSHCGAPVTKHLQLWPGSAGEVPVKQGSNNAFITVQPQTTCRVRGVGDFFYQRGEGGAIFFHSELHSPT